MRIKWYGHASFLVEGNGTRIVTDPYTPEIAGYDPIAEPADIVIMSSATDRFHSYAEQVPGNPKVINALEITETGVEAKGVKFSAVESMESIVHKTDPDQNAMYRFGVDGVEIGHMGDVGNPLSASQLEFFRGIDVLLALTGGPPTIELPDLDKVIAAVQPKITIPMHFLTDKVSLTRILPVDDFTARYPAEIVRHLNQSEVELEKSSLPAQHQIYVLDYAN
jgi:L-ascorbate metabolism protein UlaG (beta-lactamase superfamily)